MKPIPKIERRCCVRFSGAFLFLSLTLLLQLLPSESVFAQPWEEGDWQRRSGNPTQFQNSFPDQKATTTQAAFLQAEHGNAPPSHVNTTDFQQALPQPQRDLNTMESNQQPVWQGEEGESFEAESGPLKWTKTIQEKFSSLDIKKVVSSLAIVIGGYLGFVWLMGKFGGESSKSLPREVFEVIGTSPLSPGHNLQLVRLGSKLLVLVSGDEGTHPVAEVTDPDEVEYLTGLCNKNGSSRTSAGNNVTLFRRALDRARNEGGSSEAAMDKAIRKLSELAGKTNRTDFEA